MATSDAHARKPDDQATGDRSTLKLVREIAGDTGTPGKGVEPAKQEVLEAVGERAPLGRSSAVAGVLVLLAVIFAGHSIAIALGAKLPDWAGRAVVAGALLLGAGTLVMVARAVHHPSPIGLEGTKRMAKEDLKPALLDR